MDQGTADVASKPKLSKLSLSRLKGALSHTSSAFVAEYSIMLIILATVLGNLIWLVFVFFGLIVDTGNGGESSTYLPVSPFVLWLGVSSLISLPLTAILWSRTQAELTTNPDFNGELPKGGAKGFRTFWLVVAVLSIVSFFMAAVYAPLAALIEQGDVADILLGVTLPSILSIAVIKAGAFLVIRTPFARPLLRKLLWGLVGLTAVLFIVDYIWSSNLKPDADSYTPDRPIIQPYSPDEYNGLYEDEYYY